VPLSGEQACLAQTAQSLENLCLEEVEWAAWCPVCLFADHVARRIKIAEADKLAHRKITYCSCSWTLALLTMSAAM
jgi:hypothetical protein